MTRTTIYLCGLVMLFAQGLHAQRFEWYTGDRLNVINTFDHSVRFELRNSFTGEPTVRYVKPGSSTPFPFKLELKKKTTGRQNHFRSVIR